MNDDRDLVRFLQHHKPMPPPAPANAEVRLMAAVAALPPPWQARLTSRLSLGAMAGLLLATLATGWWVCQRRAIALAESKRLENAILEEWSASLSFAETFYVDVDFDRSERP
ncbi:MAG: hypothetical protein HC918_08485 [Oscillatoriales cyanobacterium SM2_1_8]|nr:hypothetical protein [Oscillatoriales cyanobacterium SM2_1_8]